MSVALKYRVELERMDRGYQARVPEIHGMQTMGLTEGETLRRLTDVLGTHIEASGAGKVAFRLEVFRT